MYGSFNFDEGGREILGNFSSDFSLAVFEPQPVNFCLFLSNTCL